MALTQVSRGLLSTSIVDNGNATAITIDSSENVGIGSSPAYKLDVDGSVRLKTGSTGTPVIVSTGSDSQGTLRFGSASNEYSINGGADYLAMIFNTNDAERMRITAAGALQLSDVNSPNDINTAIYSNSDVLEFEAFGTNGAIAFATGSSVTERMRIDDSGNTTITATGNPTLTVKGSDGAYSPSLVLQAAGGGGSVINAKGATSNSLSFQIADSEKMRIDASGNLLVGKTSADFNDNSRGNIEVAGTSGAILALKAGSTNDYIFNSGSGLQVLAGSGQVIQFYTNGSSTERMSIDSSGNLLVGTTNAAQDSGDGVKIKKDGTQGRVFVIGSSATSGEGYSMHANGSFRFYVQYSGQINSTSQSILGISDVSLKENIRDLDRGLEEILALQPRRFDWKNGDGNDIMGFVAQEVETVLPELVHDYKYDSEETKLGLKMGDMIPTLVKAIQEQQETITALTARITQLENS